MDIERYKKFALSKINEGNITKGVKSIIKNEEKKEQNYREGVNPSINRRNLAKLNSLISDVSSNRSKYNIRDNIIDNLEMLNYNLLRLINKWGVASPQNPPAIVNNDIPPPPAIDDDDDDDNDFVFPPPPAIDDDDFVFPPPPPGIVNEEGDPFPTLPLPPPPPIPPIPPIVPPQSPINTIIPEARSRSNLLDSIRNPKLKLKPIPKEPKKPVLDKNQTMLNTIRNLIDNRRSAIQDSSDEDEDEDEDEYWD